MERPFDNRSPFAAADAVRATILLLSEELKTEEAILEAVMKGRFAPDSPQYWETIDRTGHSIFYHHLQHFYQFGRHRVPPALEDGFCAACGRTYASATFAENLHAVLRIALGTTGTFQETVVVTLQAQLSSLAGGKYLLEYELDENEITLIQSYRQPELIEPYLRANELDPDHCLKNSTEFVGSAMSSFMEQIIEGYDPSGFRVECKGSRGFIRLPIGASHRFAYEQVIPVLLGYIEDLEERAKAQRLGQRLESGLITDSDLMRETLRRINRAGKSSEIVLLRGESGTGKTFYARRIHDQSPRASGPFVEVGLTADIGSDSMAQSDLFGHERGAFTGATTRKQGLFDLADGGTIFLDEVGDASPEMQARLLRVIESSTFKRLGGVKDLSVDVRVIVATNRDLEKMVQEGSFREDLYYRLTVIPIVLPPLRERREDIPALAEFLFARRQAEIGGHRRLEEGLADRLAGYHWPGNVRELDHALKHAAAMSEGDLVTEADLPEKVRQRVAESGAGRSTAGRDDGYQPGRRNSDAGSSVIDVAALRQSIRSTRPMQITAANSQSCRAHVEFAKRTWLATLIEECCGDLALISRFWDRNSEKTLRNLVHSYGLSERLKEARRHGPRPW